MLKAILVAVGMLMCTAVPALANEFDVSGTTCVPSDVTINPLHYGSFSNVNYIEWVDNSIGSLQFYCPIPVSVNPTNIWLAYSLTSGDTMSVSYLRMNKSTGAVTTVTTLNAVAGQSTVMQSFTDTVGYNVGLYFYFVRIDMHRNNGTNIQRFEAATLW